MVQVEDLVRDHVNDSVLAGGFFHSRSAGRLYGGGGAGALIGFLESLVTWVWPRLRSPMPLYVYLAVTPLQLHAFEFRFGPTRLRREVGVWARDEIRVVRRSDDVASFDLWVKDQKIELEAVDSDGRTPRVMEVLSA